MKYKTILLIALIVFAASLAVVVGQRLSAEATAVIVGVVAGVAAGIPTSLIVAWVATRGRAGETRVVEERRADSGEPRIVVVTPPSPQSSSPPCYHPVSPGGVPMAALPYPSHPRRFTVIGGEGDLE
ncbi:MAG: hypothetical protein HY260_06290 [Chloroflexi bacterium]|nr:hypothetical protein [Chloroflexota bacterium]